jgi:hypothetical protein
VSGPGPGIAGGSGRGRVTRHLSPRRRLRPDRGCPCCWEASSSSIDDLRLAPGGLFFLWMAWYGLQRFMLDSLRFGNGDATLGPFTWNQVSGLTAGVGRGVPACGGPAAPMVGRLRGRLRLSDPAFGVASRRACPGPCPEQTPDPVLGRATSRPARGTASVACVFGWCSRRSLEQAPVWLPTCRLTRRAGFGFRLCCGSGDFEARAWDRLCRLRVRVVFEAEPRTGAGRPTAAASPEWRVASDFRLPTSDLPPTAYHLPPVSAPLHRHRRRVTVSPTCRPSASSAISSLPGPSPG